MGNQVSSTSTGHIHPELTTPRKPDTSYHPHAATDHAGSYLQRLVNAMNIVPYIQDCLQRAYSFITGNNYQTPSHQQIKERAVSLLPDSPETEKTVHTINPAIDNLSTTEPHSTSNIPQSDHQKKATPIKKSKNRRKNNTPVPKEQTTIPTTSSPGKTNTLKKPENSHSTPAETSKPITKKEKEKEKEKETDTTHPKDEWHTVKPKKNKNKLKKCNNNDQERLLSTRHQKELSLTEADYKELVTRNDDENLTPYNQYKKIITKSENQLTDDDRTFLGKVFCRLLKNAKFVIPVMFKSLSIYQHHQSFMSCIAHYFPSALFNRYIHSDDTTQDQLKDISTILLDIFRCGIMDSQKRDLNYLQPSITLGDLGYRIMPPEEKSRLFMLFHLIIPKKNKTNPEPNPINKTAKKPMTTLPENPSPQSKRSRVVHDKKNQPTITQAMERKAFMEIIPDKWAVNTLESSLKTVKDRHAHPEKYNKTNSSEPEPAYNPMQAVILAEAYTIKLNIKIEETEDDQLKKSTLDSILQTIDRAMTHLQHLNKEAQLKWTTKFIYHKKKLIGIIRHLYPYEQSTKELEKLFNEIKAQPIETIKYKNSLLSTLSDKLSISLMNQLDDQTQKSNTINKTLLEKLEKHLGTFEKLSSSKNDKELQINKIRVTIGKSAIDRFKHILNGNRQTRTPPNEDHINQLKDLNKETIQWMKQQKQSTSELEKTSHTQTKTEEMIEKDSQRHKYLLKSNELITLEIAKWHILHKNHDDAARTLKEVVFTTPNLMIKKARQLLEIGELDASIEEYQRTYEKTTGNKRVITLGYAIALHTKYQKDKNKDIDTLWAAYNLTLELLRESKNGVKNRIKSDDKHRKQSLETDQIHEAVKVYSGTIFHICKSFHDAKVPLKDLGTLPSTLNAHNWNDLLTTLDHYHKPKGSTLNPQAIKEFCKTTSTYGNNLSAGHAVRRY